MKEARDTGSCPHSQVSTQPRPAQPSRNTTKQPAPAPAHHTPTDTDTTFAGTYNTITPNTPTHHTTPHTYLHTHQIHTYTQIHLHINPQEAALARVVRERHHVTGLLQRSLHRRDSQAPGKAPAPPQSGSMQTTSPGPRAPTHHSSSTPRELHAQARGPALQHCMWAAWPDKYFRHT